MTAPEGPLAEDAAVGGLDASARGGPGDQELAEGAEYFPGALGDRTDAAATASGAAAASEPLERLVAAIEQLERLTALEEQLVREIVRVTRDAAAALAAVGAAPQPASGEPATRGERDDSAE